MVRLSLILLSNKKYQDWHKQLTQEINILTDEVKRIIKDKK